jgi:hypothetical protein
MNSPKKNTRRMMPLYTKSSSCEPLGTFPVDVDNSLFLPGILTPTLRQDPFGPTSDQHIVDTYRSIFQPNDVVSNPFPLQDTNVMVETQASQSSVLSTCPLYRWINSQTSTATLSSPTPNTPQAPPNSERLIHTTESLYETKSKSTEPLNLPVRQENSERLQQSEFTPPFGEVECVVTDSDMDASSTSESSKAAARFRRDQAVRWSECYEELVVFVKEHGHCRVPRNNKKYERLSSWVKRQRYQHKLRQEGKCSFLTDERVAVLELLGFVWDSHGTIWETRFTELQEFHRLYGHCNVPYNYKNAQLASWIKAQRREMRALKEGKTITPETFQRLMRLEELDFCWKLRSSGRKSQGNEGMHSA